MEYYEVYDDETGKTFSFEAKDLNEAISRSENIDYNQYPDGEEFSFINN